MLRAVYMLQNSSNFPSRNLELPLLCCLLLSSDVYNVWALVLVPPALNSPDKCKRFEQCSVFALCVCVPTDMT